MNLNRKKKIVLIATVLIELIIGSIFLVHVYKQRTTPKPPDPDKITVIKKENLIFPEESEFKYYWELKPNTTVIDEPEWLGYQAKYTYNADGLHERFDYAVEKPSDTFRIVTLGDSFTFGQFVNTKDNWPEQLEEMLNQNLITDDIKNFEVINLGLGGSDVPYIVKRYKDIGAKYNPDLIIWFESSEGFHRLVELISPLAETCEKETPVNDKKKALNYCWEMVGKKLGETYSADEIYTLILDSLNEFALSLEGKKIIILTYEESSLGDYKLNLLKKWKERLSLLPNVIFSTVPSIYTLNQALPDGHPSREGHKMMANAIYEYLKSYVFN